MDKSKSKPENLVFSSRLRNLIEEEQITQPTLAAFVGCTRQAISLYTTGQTVPDIHILKKIAEFFGCSTDFLVGLTDTLKAEQVNIADVTPLTPKSIGILTRWKEQGRASYRQARVLNFLIEHSTRTRLFENLYSYYFHRFFIYDEKDTNKLPEYSEQPAIYEIFAMGESENMNSRYAIKNTELNDMFFVKAQHSLMGLKRRIDFERRNATMEDNNDGEHNKTNE